MRFVSRKFWFAAGTSIAIVVVGVLCAFVPALRVSLDTIVGGLCATLALYSGGNVTTKWVTKGATPEESAGEK